jgi:hypothetical protein
MGLRNVLEAGGIGFDRFVSGYPQFIINAIEKTGALPAAKRKKKAEW